MSANDYIRDEEFRYVVNLGRIESAERAAVVGSIQEALREMSSLLRDADVDTGPTTRRMQKLASTQRRLNSILDDLQATLDREHTVELSDVSSLAQQQSIGMLNTVFGAALAQPVLTPARLRALARNTLVLGHVTKDWWASQNAQLKHRYIAQLRQGIMNGETIDQLVRRIRGTSTGRRISYTIGGKRKSVAEFSGGVMDTTTREAAALVRTSVLSVSNETRRLVYEGNDDLLRGLAAVVTLDLRTSDICIARSGGAWDLEGNALPESTVKYRFPGYPPWHWQCRTVITPITRSWEDLTGVKAAKVPNEMRASLDGQVPAAMTYPEWLKTRSRAEQVEVLGRTKHDLWTKEKMPLTALTDQAGRPMRASELMEKYGSSSKTQ